MRRVARGGKFRACRGGGQGLQCEEYRDITRSRHRETLIAKLTEVQHAVEQLLAELQASERDKFAAYGWLLPPVRRRGQRYHYFRLVRIGNPFPAGATIRRLERQCTKLFTRVRAGRGRGFPSLLGVYRFSRRVLR